MMRRGSKYIKGILGIRILALIGIGIGMGMGSEMDREHVQDAM